MVWPREDSRKIGRTLYASGVSYGKLNKNKNKNKNKLGRI